MHSHSHPHSHSHHQGHAHTHTPSRRDFFASLLNNTLMGAGVLEIAAHRAAWCQALSATAPNNLFDIEKITDDVYFALAHPAGGLSNSNAAIFVNSNDVLVVDAHGRPSAAAAMIAQIKKEVTPKPVRYVVDTHFHYDHAQGNAAYLATGNKVDILASKTTKILMSKLLALKVQAALDPAGPGPTGGEQVALRLEDLRQRLGKSTSEAEKTQLRNQIGQIESYAAEMKNFTPTLPTITFDKSYVIKNKNHDLHLEFHGFGHTAGDIVVFSPQKRVLASGDIIHPGFPAFVDAYPLAWPKSIDSISRLGFDHVLGGHGRAQHDRRDMTGERNFIEELTARVIDGKKSGKAMADLQTTITAESLKSLHSDGYMASATPAALQRGVNNCIEDMYDRVERVAFNGTEPYLRTVKWHP